MVAKKRQSKRLTTRKRVKLDKKVKEKIKKHKKDIKQKERTRTPASVLRTDEEKKTYETIREGVKLRQKEYEERMKEGKIEDNSFKCYMKQVNSVIDKSDVIFEIIDARDPIGSRNEEIEQKVVKEGKKLVIVMNKIDLVPKNIVNEWHVLLKKSYPCLIYHRNFSKNEIYNILKNFTRSESGEVKIVVGVIGYPNVGKSTFINTLLRSESCSTGSKAGITRDIQQVSLEKNIKVIDSPGVVFKKDISLMNVLRNSIDLDRVDVIKYTQEVLDNINKDELLFFYQIPEFNNSKEFLLSLGNKFKLIKKKGVIDIFEAGKRFLREISAGKIHFYNLPLDKEADFLGEKRFSGESQVVFTFN